MFAITCGKIYSRYTFISISGIQHQSGEGWRACLYLKFIFKEINKHRVPQSNYDFEDYGKQPNFPFFCLLFFSCQYILDESAPFFQKRYYMPAYTYKHQYEYKQTTSILIKKTKRFFSVKKYTFVLDLAIWFSSIFCVSYLLKNTIRF